MKNQQPPKCTPVSPQSAFQKDMQFITDTLCVVRTYLAETDSVMGMVASAIEKSRSLAFSCAYVSLSFPVEYQYRARPHWDDAWTEWRTCPKEIAEEYRQCPDVHGWRYEIREVPQPALANELLAEIAGQIRSQGKMWPLAAYEESAKIVEGYRDAAPAEQLSESTAALTLDAGEVAYLAARLRRLFNHFSYKLPDREISDTQIIGIAPACIGSMLSNLTSAQGEQPTPHYLPCADQCGNAVPVGGDPVCHQCRSEHAAPGTEGEQP